MKDVGEEDDVSVEEVFPEDTVEAEEVEIGTADQNTDLEETGDPGDPGLWMCMMLMSLMSLAGLLAFCRQYFE